MREIKFRVWDADRENMWYRGSASIGGNGIELTFFENGIKWGLYDAVLGNRLVTGDTSAILNGTGKLMQYVGLKDKNGVEIYEGDILIKYVKDNGRPPTRFVVGWNKTQCGWNISAPNPEDPKHWYEVIGNVYEHPELRTKETTA